jgi:hypothetical protein
MSWKGDLCEWKLGTSRDERTRKDAQVPRAWHLKYGLEIGDRPSAAEEPGEARSTVAPQGCERFEDCGVTDQIEYPDRYPRDDAHGP